MLSAPGTRLNPSAQPCTLEAGGTCEQVLDISNGYNGRSLSSYHVPSVFQLLIPWTCIAAQQTPASTPPGEPPKPLK